MGAAVVVVTVGLILWGKAQCQPPAAGVGANLHDVLLPSDGMADKAEPLNSNAWPIFSETAAIHLQALFRGVTVRSAIKRYNV